MIGRTLSHYKILGEVSRGGMGIVYRALDLKLNREVALKVLPPELVSGTDRKRRFVQEAQAAAALKHPNIAVIHEVDEVDGVDFIAMELIEGEKLSDILNRGPLPLDRALAIATEVAEGLSKAHSKGIVHRDLKPANIMITEDGHTKVIDFGLAKLVEPLAGEHSEADTRARVETSAGTIMGTLSYLSPEQARGDAIDHRSDVFTLGVVLYEMLSGELPFKAASNAEIPYAIINHPSPPLPSNRELERIVHRCLQKDPSERYQKMKELAHDLRRFSRESEDSLVGGRNEEALTWLDSYPREEYSLTMLSRLYAQAGGRDQALTLLEQAFRERIPQICTTVPRPVFDPYRSDPRFVSILRGMGLEP